MSNLEQSSTSSQQSPEKYHVYGLGGLFRVIASTRSEAVTKAFKMGLLSHSWTCKAEEDSSFNDSDDDAEKEYEYSRSLEVFDVQADIGKRAEGNRGTLSLLCAIYDKVGEEKYKKIAPQLGTGPQIWFKYRDECNEDLDLLINLCLE